MKRGDARTFTLTFPVVLTKDGSSEPVTDVELLAMCDGTRDPADLAEYAGNVEGELPEVREAIPRLWFDPETRELVLRLAMRLARKPTAEECEALYAFALDVVEYGWGENHRFELPRALDRYRVAIVPEPRETVATPVRDAVAEHERRFAAEGLPFLEALPPDRAVWLRNQLAARMGAGAETTIELERALTELLHRRAAAAAGVAPATITLDNIDAIDDLPPDTF